MRLTLFHGFSVCFKLSSSIALIFDFLELIKPARATDRQGVCGESWLAFLSLWSPSFLVKPVLVAPTPIVAGYPIVGELATFWGALWHEGSWITWDRDDYDSNSSQYDNGSRFIERSQVRKVKINKLEIYKGQYQIVCHQQRVTQMQIRRDLARPFMAKRCILLRVIYLEPAPISSFVLFSCCLEITKQINHHETILFFLPFPCPGSQTVSTCPYPDLTATHNTMYFIQYSSSCKLPTALLGWSGMTSSSFLFLS